LKRCIGFAVLDKVNDTTRGMGAYKWRKQSNYSNEEIRAIEYEIGLTPISYFRLLTNHPKDFGIQNTFCSEHAKRV